MKLIDFLVDELPKHGGWPSGAAEAYRHNCDNYATFYDEKGNSDLVGMDFRTMKEIKFPPNLQFEPDDETRAGQTITKSQYDLVASNNRPCGFESAAKQLMQWINNNANPHSVIIIDATSAVLYSGEKSITTEEFIKD